MYPLPTARAYVALAGCCAVIAVGLVGVSAVTVTLGAAGLLGLATALSLTVPVATRLRAQRIELLWWHGHGRDAVGRPAVVGTPFEVRCELRNRGRHPVHLTDLSPVLPVGLNVPPERPLHLWLPGGTKSAFSLQLRAEAVGRAVLQGLSVKAPGPLGLFAAPLYFPSPLAVTVLPQAAQGRGRAQPPSQHVDRPGQTAVRSRGDGMELHELRELQPGDAYRSIAWRASARRGKLLVREMEREVQETLYLLVDISGTMRGGVLGQRPLDTAIEVAAYAARDALERGDTVGLMTVDGRIVNHVLPGAGLAQMPRIYEALLAATGIVDADLTEATDDEVRQSVARYLQQQEGVRVQKDDRIDVDALHGRVAQAVRGDTGVARVVGDGSSGERSAQLRRYCQLRGIPLPYRADTRGFGKARGLSEALMRAAGRTRVPRTVVLLSDLDGIPDLEPLDRTLRLLKARAHRVRVLCPEVDLGPTDTHAPGAAAPPDSATGRAVERVFAMQEARRLSNLRARLSRAGVALATVRAGKHPPATLSAAIGKRRVA